MYSLLENQRLRDADGKMRLAQSCIAEQQQAGLVHRILFHESACPHARLREMRERSLELEVRELTMLISLRNPLRPQQGAAPCPQLAIAAGHAAVRRSRNRLPSRSE